LIAVVPWSGAPDAGAVRPDARHAAAQAHPKHGRARGASAAGGTHGA